eukprot:gene19435-21359_t
MKVKSPSTPTTHVVPNRIVCGGTSDSGLCVVPGSTNSLTDLCDKNEEISSYEDEMGNSSSAVPEDPLIDFKEKRQLRRSKRRQMGHSDIKEAPLAVNKDTSDQALRKEGQGLPKAPVVSPYPINVSPLVSKETIRIWSDSNCHVSTLGKNQLQVKFEPLKNRNGDFRVIGKENQRDSPGDVVVSGKGNPPLTVVGDTSNKSTLTNEQKQQQNVRFHTVCDFKKKTVVNATKFVMNGEVCYLIPAKVLVDQSLLSNAKASANGNTENPPVKVQSSSLAMSRAMRLETEKMGLDGRLASTSFCEQLLKLAKPFDGFAELCATDVYMKSASKIEADNARQLAYASIRDFKSTGSGYPKMRVSQLGRLRSSNEVTCQINRGQEPEVNKCDKGQESEFTSQQVAFKGDRKIEVRSGECQRCDVRIQGSGVKGRRSISKGQMSEVNYGEGRNEKVLKFIIQSHSSGTILFNNNEQYRSRYDAFMNQRRREHALKSAEDYDQIVPNSDVLSPHVTKFVSPEVPKVKDKNYFHETKFYLHELNELIGYERRMSEIELILLAASAITKLERKVNDYLNQLGVDTRSRSLDHIIPISCITSSQEINDSKIPAVNPNSITASQSSSVSSERIDNEAVDFVVPQSPYENSLYVPNSHHSTSPQLSFGSNDIWAPTAKQAPLNDNSNNNNDHHHQHNDVILSQGSSQSSMLNRSTQASFSESMTDDSEAVNEFDLNFECDAAKRDLNPSSDSNQLLQAFVEELLYTEELEEEEMVDQDLALENENDMSPFKQDLFSSPIPNITPEPQHLTTPPQFSVTNLSCDVPHQSDLDFTQDSLKEVMALSMDNNSQNSFLSPLSMKVVGRNGGCDVMHENELPTSLLDGLGPNCSAKQSESRGVFNDQMLSGAGGNCSGNGTNVVLAKDLLTSDLFASFLEPNLVMIPEDPFGIGAETLISADDNGQDLDGTWHGNTEVTPVQTKRGIVAAEPPEIERPRKRGRPRKNKAAKQTTAKQSKKFRISRFDAPPQ